ncbi:hypothetical protein [Mesorhizobium sp. NZP2077]|uniref:hypothetical protein n=1 Tax=Mesorhizobium sp. NZP2077 TaxID=2483404 RepID=UPI0015570520|nr:hypothetical protein [Mesorhizobium sp. NZP2077]QKD18852.1 hypothetical protein HGP13_29560 [Mesorhizobium sp. NZP2077]
MAGSDHCSARAARTCHQQRLVDDLVAQRRLCPVTPSDVRYEKHMVTANALMPVKKMRFRHGVFDRPSSLIAINAYCG